jgi:esterase/lipase
MGGATAGIASGNAVFNEKVDYLILDCPVGSARAMVDAGMRNYVDDDEIDYVYQCGYEFTDHFWGFKLSDGEVSNYTRETKIPVLIFTSKQDIIVPHGQAETVFSAIPHNQKYLYVSESSGHCGIYYTEAEQYTELVTKFLNGELFTD